MVQSAVMRTLVLIGCLSSMPLLHAGTAWAEDDGPIADLADEGHQAMQQQRWGDAARAFEQAVKRRPTPPLHLSHGRALEAMGRLVEARRAYRRALDHPMAADAPPAYARARQEAIEALADLEPRLPILSIELDAALRRQAEIVVDGQVVSRTRLAVDPGPHDVMATAGERQVKRRVVAEEGQTHRVILDDSTEPRSVVYGGRLFWGSTLGVASLGLTATFVYATVRLDSIRSDPGYEAFSESLRRPDTDPCVAARRGTPGVDYLAQPGAFSRGAMIAACNDADTLQALQIVSVPTAVVTGTLAGYLLANVVETEPTRVGFVPQLGPSYSGATLSYEF